MSKQKSVKSFYNSTIPNDWEKIELIKLGKFSKGKGILKEQVIEGGIPCVRYGEFIHHTISLLKNSNLSLVKM